MAIIQVGISVLNPNYDPDPAAPPPNQRINVPVADGMIYCDTGSGLAWRKIIGAMEYDGSSWRMINSVQNSPAITSMQDLSICDPRGNAPTFMPLYKVRVNLSGDPGMLYNLYWFKNSVAWFTSGGEIPAGGTDLQEQGSGISDNDTIGVAVRGYTWLNTSVTTPSSPTSSIGPLYLACGRPV